MVVRTYTGKVIGIEYNASVAAVHRVHITDRSNGASSKTIGWVVATDDALAAGAKSATYHHSKTIDNVAITMREKRVHGSLATTLVITTGQWEVQAQSMPFPNAKAHPGKALLNVKVAAKYDADKDVVAPHGIIGQSYDGDDEAIDGAIDDYAGKEEVTTSAMAEGAIEGVAADYKMADKFGTAFKFSRFDATSAKPRDTSKLSGKRTKRHKGINSAGAVADVVDDGSLGDVGLELVKRATPP